MAVETGTEFFDTVDNVVPNPSQRLGEPASNHNELVGLLNYKIVLRLD